MNLDPVVEIQLGISEFVMKFDGVRGGTSLSTTLPVIEEMSV
jgi:hypothetical protein